MYKLIILAFVAAASCSSPKSTAESTSANQTETITQIQDGAMTLALGEVAQLGDLFLEFKAVLEDSRCPTGTECFWQGRAKLLVETSEDGMTAHQNEIIFGKLKNGESENHTFYNNGNISITAIAINPYPTKDSGTTNLPYELVLEVASN